jgi:hypothetical protein
VINLTLSKVRSEGRINLAMVSGIAAILLEVGTAAHSRFKISIDIEDNSSCNIPVQRPLAELSRQTDLAFWDEAVMQHLHVFEALNRAFQDVRNDSRPFGGIVVCFCSDFRQIFPVIPKGTHDQIVAACLKRSSLWRHIQLLSLTINMKLLNPSMHPDEYRQPEEFANLMLTIGEGRGILNETSQLPV